MDLLKKLIDFQIWDDKNRNTLFGNGFEDEKEHRAKAYLKSINCALDEAQAVRQNEDAESKFKCLGHGTPQARWHDCPELCDECKPYQ